MKRLQKGRRESLKAANVARRAIAPPSTGPRIVFVCQPTRSPDCNALDLGIWYSMQSRVQKVKYEKSATKSITQRIIDEVTAMWEDPGEEKLAAITETLEGCSSRDNRPQRGNSFALPH